MWLDSQAVHLSAACTGRRLRTVQITQWNLSLIPFVAMGLNYTYEEAEARRLL